jgi:hypothetical protein
VIPVREFSARDLLIKGLDNRVKVLQESYHILNLSGFYPGKTRTITYSLAFFDLKYLSSGGRQICKTNRIMKGISKFI